MSEETKNTEEDGVKETPQTTAEVAEQPKAGEKPESLNQAEKEVVQTILQKRIELGGKLRELQEKMAKDGYFDQVYPEGMKVEVDATFLNQVNRFLGFQEDYASKLEELTGQIMAILNATLVDNYILATSLMDIHKTAVDDGKTISQEEYQKAQAKKDVQKIDTGSDKKKAKKSAPKKTAKS